MNQERLLQVLVEPRVTEKGARAQELHRQYMFKVLRDATKPEIKAAVEQLFKVEVESVTTSIVRPKMRRFRNQAGFHNAWKKAFVKLKEGHEIDFLGGE
ncbi:MAG: 50S ribosomal protein L23 [Gammaproteobacteria bacterium]|nr:50S ribosomal protein L23 [Gammaproteobacteria bacterium]